MRDRGIRVNVCRGSVTDARPDLRGVHPRGWPAGSVWDNVPGATIGNDIFVATTGHPANPHIPPNGEGHGSANMMFHEIFHGIDNTGVGGHRSTAADFNNARTTDIGSLTPYQRQPGAAGQEETYAESAARFYSGDPNMPPHLRDYWRNDPLAPPH